MGMRDKAMETILVLDDESTNLKVISLVLILRGYDVLEAGSGAEAIRICKSHHQPIHLLIAESLAKTVVIDNAVRATTTTFLSPTQVQRLRTLPQDATCQHPSVSAGVKWRVIGFDRILGIDMVVTELRHDGAIQTRWESPRYNCEPMREVEELQDPQTGTITDRFERTVIKIQDGEPDHNLFTLPAYVEMLPSQRTAQNAKIHGHSPEAFTERARRGLQQKDQQYISNLLKPRQRNLWVTDRVE